MGIRGIKSRTSRKKVVESTMTSRRPWLICMVWMVFFILLGVLLSVPQPERGFQDTETVKLGTLHTGGGVFDAQISITLTEEQKSRAKAAVIGAFVADAATMPLHWIYDTSQIRSLVKDDPPEFFSPPSCPFYSYPIGELSPYGDEAYPLLKSMVDRGGLDPEGFSEDLYASFKAYPGRLNHASKSFLRNMERHKASCLPRCGAQDDQAHCLVKAPLVTARYAGQGGDVLRAKMAEAVRVHQNTRVAEDFGVAAALLLEKIILGVSVEDALKWAEESKEIPASVVGALRQALQPQTSIPQAVAKFGLNCHLPGSFQGATYGLAFGKNYSEAVRQNIIAGGDNCSRAAFLAACLAAQGGMESVPKSWREQLHRYEEIERLVDKLLSSQK